MLQDVAAQHPSGDQQRLQQLAEQLAGGCCPAGVLPDQSSPVGPLPTCVTGPGLPPQLLAAPPYVNT